VTARRTASTMQPGEPVAWGSLERAAFEDFPVVVSALLGTGNEKTPAQRFIFLVPLAILVAVIYAAPVWGLVTVLRPVGLSQTSRTAEGDITVSGVIFAVAAVSVLVHGCIWLWSGRPAKTALRGSAGMALVLGAVSAAIAAKRGTEDSVPDWGFWALPMLASAVLGGVFLLLVLQARRRAPVAVDPSGPPSFMASEGYTAAVRESVSRVSDEDLVSIREDLSAAIDDLEKRQVITPAVARRARDAELGALAGHMSPGAATD